MTANYQTRNPLTIPYKTIFIYLDQIHQFSIFLLYQESPLTYAIMGSIRVPRLTFIKVYYVSDVGSFLLLVYLGSRYQIT